MKKIAYSILTVALAVLTGCEKVNSSSSPSDQVPPVTVGELAKILSAVGLDNECMQEVYDAVSGSVGNGYDSEYTLRNLFEAPGQAVGREYLNDAVKAGEGPSRTYKRPLRDRLSEYFGSLTKAADAGSSANGQECLDFLAGSDYQVYWPGFESWDGQSMPVIAFEPLASQSTVQGYYVDADGVLQEMEVTEQMTLERPVWVVNHNDDASYVTLDVYRKNHPELGEGGDISVGPLPSKSALNTGASYGDGGSDPQFKTIVLDNFVMHRNYDPWYKGGSEFMIRMGAIDNFTAASEAELKLFNPQVTEFMVECRRSDVDRQKQVNSILVSGWSPSVDKMAFMVTEDDGGTRTKWDCSVVVKYKSKSYGFDMSLPFNSYDDIVWRGQLSSRFFENQNIVSGTFGEVEITFRVI